jgi:hypothetical protein
MARLDSYGQYPSGMEEYLEAYGWHFSKKMCEWAVSRMYKTENRRKVYIDMIEKSALDDMLKRYGLKLTKDKGYDSVYVANMCKADYYGKSVRDEASLAQYVFDTIEDADAYEGMVFTRFYADCIGSGTPINWEDMI